MGLSPCLKFVIGGALTILSWDDPVTAFFGKSKKLRHSLGRPSRSDFVHFQSCGEIESMHEFEFVRPITGRRRIMAITLKKATREDIETIWKMQVEAFTELLDKYQDFDMSPATESLEKIIAKFEQPWTTYYYIVENDIVVGAVRIVNKNDGSRKRISPIWIMGEFRNKGYAQQAMIELENIYGSDHWCLDTILQEKGNLHLYEKMGYVQTGKVEHINEKLDIVFYEKN